MLTTGKAFEEVKLSVELMTNMYKVSLLFQSLRFDLYQSDTCLYTFTCST